MPPHNTAALFSVGALLLLTPPLSDAEVTRVAKFVCDTSTHRPQQPDLSDYKGCLNTTKSGKPCSPWNVTYTSHAVRKGSSYCRNPSRGRGLWCYVDGGAGKERCIPTIDCGGAACAAESDCLWPWCDDGVCRQQRLPDKTLCDDGDPETLDDMCKAGVCNGTNPCIGKQCSTPSSGCMSEGVCHGGMCLHEAKDNVPCTRSGAAHNSVCSSGVCLGTVSCNGALCSDTVCTTASCEEGKCVSRDVADGTACEDSNLYTTARCLGGACVSFCHGRDNGCGVLLQKGDGHCSDHRECAKGLRCGPIGSCAKLHPEASRRWLQFSQLGFDRHDRCCTDHLDAGPSSCAEGVSCKDRCGASRPAESCECSCRPECKLGFGTCCSDFETACEAYETTTTCSCQGKCTADSVLPCGCSCAPTCGLHHTPCCDDYDTECTPPTSKTQCTCKGLCGRRHPECGCLCDVACGRCHAKSKNEQLAHNCHLCCDHVEEECDPKQAASLTHQENFCTCNGQCGKAAPAPCNQCFCDAMCHRHEDCCPDKIEKCSGPENWQETCTCDGACGSIAACGGCSCKPDCRDREECCLDYSQQCSPTGDKVALRTASQKAAARMRLNQEEAMLDPRFPAMCTLAAFGLLFYFCNRKPQRRHPAHPRRM